MIRFTFLLFVVCVFAQCKENPETSPTVEVNKEWSEFDGKDSNSKQIVMISGDEEYRSEEALTQLAKIMSTRHGFNCTVLYAQDSEKPGIVDGNHTSNIPGLQALENADLMVIFTRFRDLPDEQMIYVDEYLKSGKPVIGIRTATHAFKFEEDSESNYKHYGNYYAGDQEDWTDGFGRVVLGEKWISHHGHHKHQSTRGILAEGAENHEIANGISSGEIWGSTDVYGVRLPLPGDSRPIVLGQVINRAGEYDEEDKFFGMKPSDEEVAKENNEGLSVNETLMPIAWTKTYSIPGSNNQGKAFTSTIGSSTDLLNEGVRRLFVNAVFWSMDVPVPAKADVELVGNYQPTAYGFKSDEYWDERNMVIAELK